MSAPTPPAPATRTGTAPNSGSNVGPGAAPHVAPSVAIRTKPPSPKRLSRKVLLFGAAFAGAIIVAALMLGLSPQPRRTTAQQEATATPGGPPETIAQASSQYDAASFERAQAAPAPVEDQQGHALQPPPDPVWANNTLGEAPGGATPTSSGSVASMAPGARAATQQAGARDPLAVARSAPILFASSPGQSNAASLSGRDAGEAKLDAALVPPRSAYEIQAGDVIPAALVTGLNSDAPGRVIAQVTAPVYDSVTGAHLLIPQGARLIGTYENGVRYGDHRIVLVWNRLILPNGWSLNLREMGASDPTGAAGLSDTTDNHLGALSGAVGLSAIISVIANRSEDDHRSDGSLTQSVGEAAAQQAAQTGSQLVQRELAVHPTLRVRPGASVRVLVMRDITLRPYR